MTVDDLQARKIASRALAMKVRNEFVGKDGASHLIMQQVISDLSKHVKHIGCFVSLPGEVDTSALFHYCWEQGIRTSIPKVEGNVIQFYEIQSFADVAEGHFHVMEPIVGTKLTHVDDLDWMIVPLLAFDSNLNRIGYGRGYYDRYLANFVGHKAGVGFHVQQVKHVPTDGLDQRLDCVYTDRGVMGPQNNYFQHL